MDTYKFEQWCNSAVSEIVFPPDRKEVAEELLGHLCDRCEALMAQGYDEDTACDRALEAMGDAEEIAPQLAAIHRPFWGYFLRATRILLILLLLITLPSFFDCIAGYRRFYVLPTSHRYDLYYENTHVSDEVGITTRVMYQEPRQQFESDGYTWELTRAVWTHTKFADDSTDDLDAFYFQMEIKDVFPYHLVPLYLMEWIWAQDSEGRTDAPWNSGIADKYLSGNYLLTAPFTWTLDMCIKGFASQDADWIDICYTRDGRDFRFRIELPGGDTQ